MSNLVVRNIDESIVKSLKERAGQAGRSAEAEHRLILAAALIKRLKNPLPKCWLTCQTWAWTATLSGAKTIAIPMYLLDTNVISEARKGKKANKGVRAFFTEV